jgi:hypothetical protein
VSIIIQDKVFTRAVEAKWQDLYKATLQRCVASCAKHKPSIPSVARPRISCTLAPPCRTCIAINTFWTRPRIESTQLSCDEDSTHDTCGWKHVRAQPKSLGDCSVSGVRQDQVVCFTVTKIWTRYEAEHRAWQAYVERAEAHLADIDRDVLGRMLGEDDVRRYVEMRDLDMGLDIPVHIDLRRKILLHRCGTRATRATRCPAIA